MYSVMNCEKSKPPTTASPSDCRASAPAPTPKAMGIVPNSAARVVIMTRPEAQNAALDDGVKRRQAVNGVPSRDPHCLPAISSLVEVGSHRSTV